MASKRRDKSRLYRREINKEIDMPDLTIVDITGKKSGAVELPKEKFGVHVRLSVKRRCHKGCHAPFSQGAPIFQSLLLILLCARSSIG